jgi:hypothetical protein
MMIRSFSLPTIDLGSPLSQTSILDRKRSNRSIQAMLRDGLANAPDDPRLMRSLASMPAACAQVELRDPAEAVRLAEQRCTTNLQNLVAMSR